VLTFTAQILAGSRPLLWPFLRALALFRHAGAGHAHGAGAVRIGLAGLIVLAAQASLPAMPVVPLDSRWPSLLVVQHLLIGITLGFAVRWCSPRWNSRRADRPADGPELRRLLRPRHRPPGHRHSRFFGTTGGLAVHRRQRPPAGDGQALVQSFHAFPVGPSPSPSCAPMQPQAGARDLRLGLWIALPLVGMLLFVNLVLGVISRVAPQINVFAVGFPITLAWACSACC
jgi:flagellar biosynthetic protein FliR